MKSKNQKKRFRDYGFKPGFLPIGRNNTITDVKGVLVGHTTKIKGQNIRTGVTVIDPGTNNLFRDKLPAAIAVGNGFGKLAGITQVEELGTIETPIALTNTLAIGPVMRGIVDIVIEETSDLLETETINAVVGETNDGLLNNIHKDIITKQDVWAAYQSCSNKTEIGNVGAGTGTRAFSWKGGIGTSSRIIKVSNKKYTVGVLVQTNFGGALNIMGVPIGRLLHKTDFDSFLNPSGDGSCMIVIATDAPFTSRQLKRIAKRSFVGLVRTGSVLSHGSGDYSITFSTNREGLESTGLTGKCINDQELTKFFLGAAEAVEESVYEALFAAETMQGRNKNILKALPIEKVIKILKRYGVVK